MYVCVCGKMRASDGGLRFVGLVMQLERRLTRRRDGAGGVYVGCCYAARGGGWVDLEVRGRLRL